MLVFKAVPPLHVSACILLTCGKHLYDRIISLRREIWVHKTSLAPPLLMKCMYQTRKVSGHVFCESNVSIFPLSKIFLLDFETVLIVWYFLLFFYEERLCCLSRTKNYGWSVK